MFSKAFASDYCCERNFEYPNCFPTRTCGVGRPHVGLCHALLVNIYSTNFRLYTIFSKLHQKVIQCCWTVTERIMCRLRKQLAVSVDYSRGTCATSRGREKIVLEWGTLDLNRRRRRSETLKGRVKNLISQNFGLVVLPPTDHFCQQCVWRRHVPPCAPLWMRPCAHKPFSLGVKQSLILRCVWR